MFFVKTNSSKFKRKKIEERKICDKINSLYKEDKYNLDKSTNYWERKKNVH